MQYSLCIWGDAHVWDWGALVVCGRIYTWFHHAELRDEGTFLAHGRRLNVRFAPFFEMTVRLCVTLQRC